MITKEKRNNSLRINDFFIINIMTSFRFMIHLTLMTYFDFPYSPPDFSPTNQCSLFLKSTLNVVSEP